MAQYQLGNKPISEPAIIQCTDAYKHDQFPIHQSNMKNDVKYEDEWWNSVHYQKITFLTHWGRVTHICVSNITIIGSDNGLSPGWHQAITWTNAGILSIGTLGTNFSEILIEILTFSSKNMRLKVSSGKWRPFCLGPNVLSGIFSHLTGGMHTQVSKMLNLSSPGRNGHHFTDDIFNRIFQNEEVRILIEISLKFVPKGPIGNNPHWFRWWLGAK